MNKISNITLQIDVGKDTDAEELHRLARLLRDEIRKFEVESVDLVRDKKIPKGAKSIEALTFGALAVSLLPAVIPKLIEFLKDWSLRGENRKIKIKTQVRDKSVEVEYNPEKMSPAEVIDLVRTLTSSIEK